MGLCFLMRPAPTKKKSCFLLMSLQKTKNQGLPQKQDEPPRNNSSALSPRLCGAWQGAEGSLLLELNEMQAGGLTRPKKPRTKDTKPCRNRGTPVVFPVGLCGFPSTGHHHPTVQTAFSWFSWKRGAQG